MGYGSTFSEFCWISAKYGVVIGENTLIGPYTIIHSANHVIKNIDIEQNGGDEKSWWRMQQLPGRITGEKVIIGSDVWIGARVTILAGSVIPDKCVIGAGTIITKSNSKNLRSGDIVCNDIKLKILGNRQAYD
jgi:acetyltransferase-like isoleucine patch superfamily enzyme